MLFSDYKTHVEPLVGHSQGNSHVSPYHLLIDCQCDFTCPSKKSWGINYRRSNKNKQEVLWFASSNTKLVNFHAAKKNV